MITITVVGSGNAIAGTCDGEEKETFLLSLAHRFGSSMRGRPANRKWRASRKFSARSGRGRGRPEALPYVGLTYGPLKNGLRTMICRRAKRIIHVTPVCYCLAVGVVLSACSNGASDKSRYEAASRVLQERIEFHRTHIFYPEERHQNILDQYLQARAALQKDPDLQSTAPYLFLASIMGEEGGDAKGMEIWWMERGFDIIGFYMIDPEGNDVEYIDADYFSGKFIRDIYENTYIRQAGFTVGTKERDGREYDLVLPQGFDLENARVGLINSSRDRLAHKPLSLPLSSEPLEEH